MPPSRRWCAETHAGSARALEPTVRGALVSGSSTTPPFAAAAEFPVGDEPGRGTGLRGRDARRGEFGTHDDGCTAVARPPTVMDQRSAA
jgi:hypothetical protein